MFSLVPHHDFKINIAKLCLVCGHTLIISWTLGNRASCGGFGFLVLKSLEV